MILGADLALPFRPAQRPVSRKPWQSFEVKTNKEGERPVCAGESGAVLCFRPGELPCSLSFGSDPRLEKKGGRNPWWTAAAFWDPRNRK